MRSSFILALGLSAIASASAKVLIARDYPTCATPCLTNPNLHGCGITDFTCLCTNTAFLNESSQCIYDHCTDPKDLKQATDTANGVCEAAGVTITSTYTPTQSRSQSVSSTASVSASVTNTSTASGSPTTTGAPASSTTASATSSGAPATTSNAAAARLGSSGASFVMAGAALLGAFAL